MDSATAQTSRWFVAYQNEKRGPYSWRALLALASRGELDPDAVLIKEHSARWLRARALRALFTSAPAVETADAAAAPTAPPQPPQPPPQQPNRIQLNPRSAAAVALPGLANVQPAAPELVKAQAAPPKGPPEATNMQPTRPAEPHRSLWHTPWVMEGLAAASISVLLGAIIVLGCQAYERLAQRETSPVDPIQHVANPMPDASR